MHRWVGVVMFCLVWPGTALAEVGEKGCAALAARVDAIPGRGPALLPSYDNADTEPALAGAAFTYDNALAIIALQSCGKRPQALRLGEALLTATTMDRAGAQGRLRNAYRAGPQSGTPQPHGWWDATAGRWAEDPMQVGTATGNVAWAGLALLTLAEPRFTQGATVLARWLVDHTASSTGGFTGGIHGDGADTLTLGWKSTEHNVDAAALFHWLARSRPQFAKPAQQAQAFVARQFENGHFLTGTLPDGVSPNRATSGLDAQLWPLLLDGAPEAWHQSLSYAERAHGTKGGFDFNDDRDGIWWEGTAQAALAYAAAGRRADADRLLGMLAGQFSPGGYLWATSTPKLTTGLALGPDSKTDDFHYFRRPHLAPTAWAVLAAKRWNPFTGKVLP
ncbi:MAG: hypothetical protein H7Y60_08095 [Rhodospirillaceae bacterium]|nr:hypothetical protein [Rhodospirillales bacterium]